MTTGEGLMGPDLDEEAGLWSDLGDTDDNEIHMIIP